MRHTTVPVLALLLCVSGMGAVSPQRNQQPVTEITLERISVTMTGIIPVSSVSLHTDGTVVYVGKAWYTRVGTYVGHTPPDTFQRLAELSRLLGYSRLQDNYSRSVTHSFHVNTSVVQGGHRKRIDNYADAGPTALWAFETTVESVVDHVYDWKKSDEKER